MDRKRKIKYLLAFMVIGTVSIAGAYWYYRTAASRYFFVSGWLKTYPFEEVVPEINTPFQELLARAALERTKHQVRYDPKYVLIPYPMGDVPSGTGVCTDVIIRSYRSLGIDLQKKVHLDMLDNFDIYPQLWGLKKPDTNIDHRRVPNLMMFFSRHGDTLPISDDPCDYHNGHIVAWDLGGGVTHIGIVVRTEDNCTKARPQIVHNIGSGPKLEDRLFSWRIIGHFRYFRENINLVSPDFILSLFNK